MQLPEGHIVRELLDNGVGVAKPIRRYDQHVSEQLVKPDLVLCCRLQQVGLPYFHD